MGTHHAYNTFPDQQAMSAVSAQFPGHVSAIMHRGQSLLLPHLSTEPVIKLAPNPLSARVSVPASAPVIRDLGRTWDIAKHAEARQPVSFGQLSQADEALLRRELPAYAAYVIDMPIKMPGTNVRLPGELGNVSSIVQRILDVEAQLNPRYDDYFAYLSLHQGQIEAGRRQREMPAHVDGFQGQRWTTKQPADHSYMVSDAVPTVFYPRSFPLEHLDLSRDDVYDEFAAQIAADPEGAIWTPQSGELILMDAYCVHRGGVASTPTQRTWLQVTFATRIYDRVGNTHNDHFDYSWEMVARDLDPQIKPRHRLAS